MWFCRGGNQTRFFGERSLCFGCAFDFVHENCCCVQNAILPVSRCILTKFAFLVPRMPTPLDFHVSPLASHTKQMFLCLCSVFRKTEQRANTNSLRQQLDQRNRTQGFQATGARPVLGQQGAGAHGQQLGGPVYAPQNWGNMWQRPPPPVPGNYNTVNHQRQQNHEETHRSVNAGLEIPDNSKPLRTPEETNWLRANLEKVFPDESEKIHRILFNHPFETDLNKLSGYLLEVL